MANALSDEEIMKQAIEGDKQAVDELGNRFQEFVLCICRGKVPVDYVEDVANDTWVGIQAGMQRFEFRCSVKTWIQRITDLRIATYWRKSAERKRQEAILRKTRVMVPPSLPARQSFSIVAESFPEPQNERERNYLEIFSLMEEGMTNHQIAQHIGKKTPEAVRSAYRRGKRYYFSDSSSDPPT
jgi:DNA-directed RNA polymerase specialized sigma24 family protein